MLRYSLSILLKIVSSVAVSREQCALVNKLAAATLRFRSACEEELHEVLNDE